MTTSVSQTTNGPKESFDTGTVRHSTSGLTSSTTDESVKGLTSSSTPSTSTINPNQTTSEINAGQLLPHLPNITPVRGHTNYQGWL